MQKLKKMSKRKKAQNKGDFIFQIHKHYILQFLYKALLEQWHQTVCITTEISEVRSKRQIGI